MPNTANAASTPTPTPPPRRGSIAGAVTLLLSRTDDLGGSR
jgi:hypothetical protein